MQLRRCVIGPSILSADFAFLFKECQEMVEVGATSLHIDIMDGYFIGDTGISYPILPLERQLWLVLGSICQICTSIAILWSLTPGITSNR